MVALSEHFKSEGPGRESEWARQRRWFIKAKHDHQRREEIADKIEDGVAALATEVVMATQTQIQTFEVKLDSYDAATVTALMENQELIDAVTDRIADILTRAYVMQDGRRVFKTEDGTQVFDEFGTEVSADELDRELIGDNRPTYEEYAADVERWKLNARKFWNSRNRLMPPANRSPSAKSPRPNWKALMLSCSTRCLRPFAAMLRA